MAGPTSTTPALWFKADAGAYVDAGSTLATNGQTVQQWNDQSGNTRNLSQATSGSRPTYNTAQYGSLPALRFARASSNFMDTATFGAALTQPNLYFFVIRQVSLSTFQTFLDTNDGAHENAFLATNADQYRLYAGTDQTSTATTDTNLHIFQALFSGAGSYLLKDGASIIAANSGTQTLPQLRLGSNPSPGSYADADFCEVLVYNGTIPDAAEIIQIVEYLQRWNYYTYGLSTFTNAGQNLLLYLSTNGTTFIQTPNAFTPSGGLGTLRDPHLTYIPATGILWLTHTLNGGGLSTSFGLGRAVQTVAPLLGLNDFATETDVDCSAVVSGGNARTWSPRGFVDPTAPQGWRVYFTASSSGASDTGFQIYETHPTSSAADPTWSTPVAVGVTGLPDNMLDPFMILVSGVYYLWFKNENTKYLEVASSSSPTTGFTSLRTGDWMGIGNQLEGPCIVLEGSTWVLYPDRYVAGTGYGYTTQAQGAGDWTGTNATAWAAVGNLTITPSVVSNGTVMAKGTYSPVTFNAGWATGATSGIAGSGVF